MAVKLDMSKAYDRVEWSFVQKVMKKLGFDFEWVDTLMKCVFPVSYSVVFNGVTGKTFFLSRGLQYGDLLSPFLFLFCGEGLSSLMRLATDGKLIRGVKASRSGPQISHLLFTNDCIMFGEATERGALSLKRILHEYGVCSGQSVNYTKSTIFFSSNTREEEKKVIAKVLGVQSSNNLVRHLGFSNVVDRSKKVAFQGLKDGFRQRIDNWSIKHLSQEGKEVFIKVVLKSIPTYSMACFLLPKPLCNELERSIWSARRVLEDGLCWRVGKGDHISIWTDLWILGYEEDRLLNHHRHDNIVLVADLVNDATRSWKADLIKNTFRADVARKIMQLPLANSKHEDFQVWRGEQSGIFFVRSAYKLLQEAKLNPIIIQTETKTFYKKLWNLQVPPKLKITIWRISWNYIPSLPNLKVRRVVADSHCPKCHQEEENDNHVFSLCPTSTEVWRMVKLPWILNSNIENIWSWLTWIFS
ncbi:hypothetical protein J1N35_028320 [Gossypium stocksii]|uniref:Reverse transcriptase domain-containing protein n=1 Tax=Gossypium stocksii TaxID=47602 RepID=A0A9D3UVY6_9ROSI|nr:hypothetical protein J1N35_028320 [Gossypium stocksii]